MRGFPFAALVLVACGGSPGETDADRETPPLAAGSTSATGGTSSSGAAGETAAGSSSAPEGGSSGAAAAGGGAGAPEPAAGSGGASAGSSSGGGAGGSTPVGGRPSGGTGGGSVALGGAGSGGMSAAAGAAGGPTAGSGGAHVTDPPGNACESFETTDCQYRPAFNVCNCKITASHCGDAAAECWRVSVAPYVSGFKEPASPLCALDPTPDCAASDAAIEAYCCQ